MSEYIKSSPAGVPGSPASINEIAVLLGSMETDAPLGQLLAAGERAATAQKLIQGAAEGLGSAALGGIANTLYRAGDYLAASMDAVMQSAIHFEAYEESITSKADGVEVAAEVPVATLKPEGGQPIWVQSVHRSDRPAKTRRGGGRNSSVRKGANESSEDPGDAAAVRLTPPEILAGINSVANDLRSQLPYNSLAAATRRAVLRGNEDALFIPAVRGVVDAVLRMMEPSPVHGRLPLEVDERAVFGQNYAHRAAEVLVNSKTLERFYTENVFLQDFVTPEVTRALRSAAYVGLFGSTVFSDTSFVAGGALRKLQAEFGDIPDAVEIIANSSRGLSMVSGIPKDKVLEVFAFLGTPYVHRGHLEVQVDDTGRPVTVSFTPRAIEKIHSYFGAGKGCPARQLKAVEGHYATELDRGWADVVRFLVPQGATANNTAANGRWNPESLKSTRRKSTRR